MLWFTLFLAAAAAYLACYAAHCLRRRHIMAAVGSFVLMAPALLLLIAFVSIMLQTA